MYFMKAGIKQIFQWVTMNDFEMPLAVSYLFTILNVCYEVNYVNPSDLVLLFVAVCYYQGCEYGTIS